MKKTEIVQRSSKRKPIEIFASVMFFSIEKKLYILQFYTLINPIIFYIDNRFPNNCMNTRNLFTNNLRPKADYGRNLRNAMPVVPPGC